ncbi:5'-nucleotidase C-terminal domain-containing protein [Photobacterium sp. BZF1]|uniref:bifunctional metallophosphatase/5'-nucleotidase n=1 Tax=Photobacterium sp. BZF1 TaxID=1904457 RepID=UPI001653E411|nr:5'-nucleotidase C-terminal domain-containing protein [Photobacterium sp. BZF1]MBC7002744.1 5'-nucleotidase C-terminal domain-containing protein [Photobacterium sp. BZF1]
MMNKTLLSLAIVIGLVGCNSSSSDNDDTFDLRILHINDHHSKLDATGPVALTLGGVKTEVEIGGFPRLVTKFNELQNDSTLRLHAGDAITGTMFYSLFREELPDALMMNQVCFDAFALGNHEFDDGNEQLAHFIETLKNGEDACGTEVLAANIEVPSTNPIYGIYDPYKVFDVAGQQVGVIGIDISSKTQASSSPSADTEFFDEVETSQRYIDILKEQGVDKIVLLTHYMYSNDIAMAKQLTDVDVIVGGDSHSLLADSELHTEIGFGTTDGEYPTVVQNADGNDVCIVQAWENALVLGELNVSFNEQGNVTQCSGTPHLLLGDEFINPSEDSEGVHTDEELDAINQYIASKNELSSVEKDTVTAEKLAFYSDQVDEKMKEIIGYSVALLCNERTPGSNHSSGALCVEGSEEREFMNQHGSIMANVVSEAFVDMSIRSDIAIQNSGGVRTTIAEGDVSVGHAFNVLPFSNYLVNLDMTGQEIVNTIEDAIDNVVVNDSSGAFPAAANLRFDVDMNAEKGQRITDVQARRKLEDGTFGEWHDIELTEIYVVVTNDFIAAGGDRYDSFVPVYEDDSRREDTGLLYTDSLINYIKKLEDNGETLDRPDVSEMSVQSFIALN